MNRFDKLVERMDAKQDETFAINVAIDNVPSRGVFNEEFDEFEGAGVILVTLDVLVSNLPKSTKNGSIVNLVDSGRVFKVTKPPQRRDLEVTLIMQEINSG